MKRKVKIEQRVVRARRDAPVSFSVVCQPRSGASLEEMERRLSLRTISRFQPDDDTRHMVMKRLWSLGFDVFDIPGPVVNARGSVQIFGEVFGVNLVRQITKTTISGSKRALTQRSLRLVATDVRKITKRTVSRSSQRAPTRKSPKLAGTDVVLSPAAIPEALMLTLAPRPTLAIPSLPPEFTGRSLHLPGDVAQLMRASATHRQALPGGDRATGGGVMVAIVDSGFAEHPFYRDHGYRITRRAASDTEEPSLDASGHGTTMLAGLFACAPDVDVIAMKMGDDSLLAIKEAVSAGARIVSLSWGFHVAATKKKLPTVPRDLLAYAIEILTMIQDGITFVAAVGNLGARNFPAMMPDVIAVGGVTVAGDDELLAHDGSSSFKTQIYPGRTVPDVCGIAAEAVLPFRITDSGPDWKSDAGYTSFATAQVAGIAALLLQKKPSIAPADIRERLIATATDVSAGTTASYNTATTGQDLATGAGLANALEAWISVT